MTIVDASDLFSTILDFMSLVQLESTKNKNLNGPEKKKKVLILVEKFLEDNIQDPDRLGHMKFILNMSGGLIIDGIKSIANKEFDIELLRRKITSCCLPFKKA